MQYQARFVATAAVLAGAAHTLPSVFPDIDAVGTARIVRPTSQVAVGNHTQAEVAGALADHAVHGHDFVSTGIGGAVANAMGLPAGLDAINDAGAAGAHTVAAGSASGVQNNAAAQAHAAGAAALAHALTGADPTVAVTPTKATGRTFSLDQNVNAGDWVELNYMPVGGRLIA